jgi:hypothetical protein
MANEATVSTISARESEGVKPAVGIVSSPDDEPVLDRQDEERVEQRTLPRSPLTSICVGAQTATATSIGWRSQPRMPPGAPAPHSFGDAN